MNPRVEYLWWWKLVNKRYGTTFVKREHDHYTTSIYSDVFSIAYYKVK